MQLRLELLRQKHSRPSSAGPGDSKPEQQSSGSSGRDRLRKVVADRPGGGYGSLGCVLHKIFVRNLCKVQGDGVNQLLYPLRAVTTEARYQTMLQSDLKEIIGLGVATGFAAAQNCLVN